MIVIISTWLLLRGWGIHLELLILRLIVEFDSAWDTFVLWGDSKDLGYVLYKVKVAGNQRSQLDLCEVLIVKAQVIYGFLYVSSSLLQYNFLLCDWQVGVSSTLVFLLCFLLLHVELNFLFLGHYLLIVKPHIANMYDLVNYIGAWFFRSLLFLLDFFHLGFWNQMAHHTILMVHMRR